jgi:hypothetical protein
MSKLCSFSDEASTNLISLRKETSKSLEAIIKLEKILNEFTIYQNRMIVSMYETFTFTDIQKKAIETLLYSENDDLPF